MLTFLVNTWIFLILDYGFGIWDTNMKLDDEI